VIRLFLIPYFGVSAVATIVGDATELLLIKKLSADDEEGKRLSEME
jgi:hypothetical protein